jgi:hypothetical protein
VGALAIAGASAANAATVQITFANNVVSEATGLTNFVADLTGDQSPDVVGWSGIYTDRLVRGFSNLERTSALAQAGIYNGAFSVFVNEFDLNVVSASRRSLVSFSFVDSRIGVGSINGWLDVAAFSSSSEKLVQIHRLIFDDASTTAPTGLTSASTGIAAWSSTSAVPEASTSLGLLALGAGGLLTRRRLKRAA